MQQLIRVPQNTISECSRLLNHWISSFASFAVHIAYIRECLETLRTREEALEDMYRRRESLDSKANSAWKKTGGSLGGNPLYMGLLNELHAFDTKIANEKASLSDWKRIKGREWVGVLFGGLLECSEKGTVVATLAQEIIGNLPTETVQPGIPQAYSSGTSQTKPLVVKAERKLDNISYVVGRVGGEAELLFDENRTGGIPRHSPSHRIPPKVSSQQDTVVVDERDTTNTRSRTHRNVGLVDHFRIHLPCSALTVPTILVVGVVHPRFLPVTPYPRTMGQRHLS
jgi:hypothetical protein